MYNHKKSHREANVICGECENSFKQGSMGKHKKICNVKKEIPEEKEEIPEEKEEEAETLRSMAKLHTMVKA